MNISENTVAAENQMINSSELSFLGNEQASFRVLVLGNSITRHGPNAEISWDDDWGMAASAPEKDYVHRLYQKFTDSGQDVWMRIRQSAYWERHFLDDDCLPLFAEDRDFNADLIIFRLGDNVPAENAPYFQEAIKQFMVYLNAQPGKVIFTSCFWDRPELNNPICNVAKEYQSPYTEIIGTDEMKAYGMFEHSGVCAHPSDFGMEIIAERIFACYANK